jgi:uncharacterized RDD family membrane protein YckC
MQLGPNRSKKTSSATNYCPLPRRLMVMLYDAVIMLGLLMIGSALALPFGEAQKIALQDFWFTLWLLFVCFAYLGACWHYGGMTVGMRAWRVVLINTDGGKISWPRCLLRFLLSFLSLAALGLGFVWAIFDQKNQAWHDIAAHTVLLRSGRSA